MADERALDLDRRDAMAGDVHDVVDAAEKPEVAVLVDARPVADEIRVLPAAPVRLLVALGIAEYPTQHGRPRFADHEIATAPRWHRVALVVEDGRVDGRERLGRGAWLERGDAGQRRDEDHAGLRLPPRVHHRRAVAADVLAIPDPGLGVDGLADAAAPAPRAEAV